MSPLVTKNPPLAHEPADRGFIEHGLRELVRNTPTAPTVESNRLWLTTPNVLNTCTLAISSPKIFATDRAAALAQTGNLFKELLGMVATLGLHPTDELLKLMHLAYEVRSINAAIERERKASEERMRANTKRTPMPVRSRVGDFMCPVDAKIRAEVTSTKTPNCPPKMIVNVTARPQAVAYRVEDIQITKHPAHWLVHGITCGNVDQAVQRGPLGGVAFDENGILRNVRLMTLQTAMDFVMHVEYIGPNPEGEPFEAVTVGLEASYG